MGFEDIPEDREESYLCEKCKVGNITKNSLGIWECDNCDVDLTVPTKHHLGFKKD